MPFPFLAAAIAAAAPCEAGSLGLKASQAKKAEKYQKRTRGV